MIQSFAKKFTKTYLLLFYIANYQYICSNSTYVIQSFAKYTVVLIANNQFIAMICDISARFCFRILQHNDVFKQLGFLNISSNKRSCFISMLICISYHMSLVIFRNVLYNELNSIHVKITLMPHSCERVVQLV